MNKIKCLLILTASVFTLSINSQNPIIQTYFTADPAPMVHNDTVFVYTTHDEDETVDNFFTMFDWRCYSSTDMVNWTDHGAVASLDDFEWSDKNNGAWAPQAIERNGKFYLYCPIHGDGIGVLVSDSPTGPFHDPLGKRLTDTDHMWDDIDPTVFIDDDGQAYLFWGNPNMYYVKLNEDMVSYDKSIGENGIVSMEMTKEAFGQNERENAQHTTQYTEGPWIYKHNNLYYLVYAASGIPEYIAYSTAPSVEGPWTYEGIIMERAPHLAFTNHPGIVNYKGNAYFFYHTHELSGGEGFKRSVSVEQFDYNEDGTIPLITPTKEGVTEAVSNLNPFQKIEAETIAWSSGVKTKKDETGVYVSNISDGDYIKVRDVDFDKKAKSFEAGVASASEGGKIEIRLGSPDGIFLGVCDVNNTGGWQNWTVTSCNKLKRTSGIHDLYFVFKGNGDNLFTFDWWRFKK